MSEPISDLLVDLERERSTLERELTEIALLMQQVASEAQRHEERRVQAEERVAALEKDAHADPAAVAEARVQLLSQTRRQTMMLGQTEVLAGKQRALQRFQKRLEETVPVLAAIAGGEVGAAGDSSGSAGNGRVAATGSSMSREVLAAQEQMRREIAREMHDGPAQSIANIALQAQVVQRLFARDPAQAQAELGQLVQMVQHALEATKNFIFNVRPMVLDDLGLVPTLRRTAAERTRRSGVPVAFESVGADRRLSTEVESGLFRMVDDAVQGLLDARPAEVLVRLDWQENGLRVGVRGRPSGQSDAPADKARAAVASARRDRIVPAALASMIHDQETVAGRGLSTAAWSEISQRAGSFGIDVSLSTDGWKFEAAVTQRP